MEKNDFYALSTPVFRRKVRRSPHLSTPNTDIDDHEARGKSPRLNGNHGFLL